MNLDARHLLTDDNGPSQSLSLSLMARDKDVSVFPAREKVASDNVAHSESSVSCLLVGKKSRGIRSSEHVVILSHRA